MRAPVIIANAKNRGPTMSHSAWKLPMPSPMRSNHPSVRIESSETMRGAGISKDRVSFESVTKTAYKTRRSAFWAFGRLRHFHGRRGCWRSAVAPARRMVRKSEAGSAVATDAGSVCDLGERSHAAADPGQDGARLLRALDAALSKHRGVGGRRRR